MENFEKCTVAMLGGPCSQHVTGNTSRLNQPQRAIITPYDTVDNDGSVCTYGYKKNNHNNWPWSASYVLHIKVRTFRDRLVLKLHGLAI